MGAFIKQLLN